MESLPLKLPTFEPGWVWLVGGPGDPGLLSLHALNALRQADAVVYDALVGPEVLSLTRHGCLLEYAGKRGGKPSPKQPDISRRLVQLALQGKRVLRLKGGDPFVFGRGGEEVLALTAARVPFRIVPGISAGVGALAYAGIPLTHRDTNAAVAFVTGHGASGDLPDGLDWSALAKGAPVLVFYMAMKHLGVIRKRLLAAGRRGDEPLAVVSKATLPDQAVLETTLESCIEDIAESGIAPPAIVVLGEVVRLRAAMDWQGAAEGRQLDSDPLGTRRQSDAG